MITIIAVGKLKNSAYRQLTEDYIKRISRFSSVKLIELGDEDFDNDPAALLKEGRRIQAAIPLRSYVIACDCAGKSFSSEEFAEALEELFVSGKSDLCFIIGGSGGIWEEVKSRADMLVSFSRFTFPHNLFRVILCEQIYRAFKIISREKYHK